MDPKTLAGIRVLDLSRLLPGPFCSLILADLGADVIKVEDPKGGDYLRWAPPYQKSLGAMFCALNRNKKSIAIDLKRTDGVALFRQLATTADVVLESFRPGVMDRLGVGYEALKALNPGLVYCAISGYGQDGPYRDRAGHDLNYVGLTGAAAQTGVRDRAPGPAAFQLADVGGGALYAALGILAALHARARSGLGQFVDVAMQEGALSFMAMNFGKYFADMKPPIRGGEQLNGGIVCYHVYETKDGQFMGLAALEPKFWQAFCTAVERPDLKSGHAAPTVADNAVYRELVALFKSRTQAEWTERFAAADCCCEPILDVADVPAHPQVIHRKQFFELTGPQQGSQTHLRLPLTDPERSHTEAPLLGADTATLLQKLGLAEERIAELQQGGAILCGK